MEYKSVGFETKICLGTKVRQLRVIFGLLYPSIFLANGFGLLPTSSDRRRSEDLTMVKKIYII